MSIPPRRELSPLRVKLALISFGAFLLSLACSWLRPCVDLTPPVMCYTGVVPSATAMPTPLMMCYEATPLTSTPIQVSPTVSPTPTPVCYTPTPSPVCYTPTPSPVSSTTPSVTPQARHTLLETLLAEGRFPEAVAGQLRR